MLLVGQRVTVVGLGVSGVAAAELCLKLGATVSGIDRRPRQALGDVARLPIDIRTEGYGEDLLARADVVVVSPGIPDSARLLTLVRPGALVLGELELGARLLGVPVLAVGGTNGKSTTTELLGAMLSASGLRTFCGGNLGTPLCRAVGGSWDAAVVEVSSFQLELAPTFRPMVSVLLNITDDHLDRYPDFDAYAWAKGNAFVNQSEEDVAVIPAGDTTVARQAQRGRGHRVSFGIDADYAIDERGVVERSSGERFELTGTALLQGQAPLARREPGVGQARAAAHHNALNAAAAIAAARAFSVDPASIRRALTEYRLLPHRLARVRELCGVVFYDDSKATNVGAVVAALGSVQEPKLVLIAGGKDKGGSYDPLARALSDRARAVVTIGEAAPLLESVLAGIAPVARAASIDEAVALAARFAQPGDAVVLSPACASFDMFESYSDRGRRFVRAVGALTEGSIGGAASGGLDGD